MSQVPKIICSNSQNFENMTFHKDIRHGTPDTMFVISEKDDHLTGDITLAIFSRRDLISNHNVTQTKSTTSVFSHHFHFHW